MNELTAARPIISQGDLARGVLWALAAAMFWGGAFIAPLVLQGYTSIEIAAGRFMGSGLFSLLVLAITAARGHALGVGGWRTWATAALLGCIGGFLYFVLLTEGVQRANAAVVTLIIGILPIAIPLVAQLSDGSFNWRTAVLPSALIFAGLLAVHGGTHGFGMSDRMDSRYLSGLGFGFAALASWTWYAIHNARALTVRPGMSAALWSSIQGVALLPFALPVIAVSVMAAASHGSGGPTGRVSVETFLLVSLALGIVSSWMAMWCWNRASQLLPADLAGQLIVFETVASLTYIYLWTQAWPPPLVVAGAGLLLGGVLLGIVRLQRRSQ